VAQYGIRVLPLNFYFGDKVYRDWVDITPSEAYELFLADTMSYKSSATSPEDCLEAYREVSQLTSDILVITVSSKLSMLYESAQVARVRAEAELPGVTIEVLDSRTATAAEGFIALAAAKAAEAGESLPEVIGAAETMRGKVGIIALLDTVRYVYRSGRVPKVAAQAGSILNIRPIFTISEKVHFIGVARNREQGISRMLAKMKDKVGRRPVHIAVMHAYAQNEAERLKERILSEFNCAEIWLTEFSPLMGYACGTGTLGVAFYSEEQGLSYPTWCYLLPPQ